MSGRFELDPRIAAGTVAIAETDLCLVRLMNDSRYPWLLLIPRRPDVVELFDLPAADRQALTDLAADIAGAMAARFEATKMNIGALGNRVPQFHLHVIARRTGDAAWPNAVWDGTAPVPYDDAPLHEAVSQMRGCLPRSLDHR